MTGHTLNVQPLDTSTSFRTQVYHALKQAITEMDIYDHKTEIRLDERQVSEKLGVSRTPIREAMTLLEQEGFVRSQPRRGIFVIRKTKREILEMVTVWAALESMAARVAAEKASDEDIRSLRELFSDFEQKKPAEHVNDYSDANIAFHKAIIRMSGCQLIQEITENLFIHMRAIRKLTIGQDNRAERSIVDHKNIIDALERRDPVAAEQLVRDHTLGLATHIEQHGNFLDWRLRAGFVPDPAAVQAAFAELPEFQAMNQANRSVYAAVWCDAGWRILLAREDVGRHNALDKMIGALIRGGLSPSDGFAILRDCFIEGFQAVKSTDMIRMANQIATYFKSYPHEEAVAETAGHIKSFGDPRMRDALYAHVVSGGSGLDDLVREAVAVLKPGSIDGQAVQ